MFWNFIIGPILALLPKPWREALPFARNVRWGPAAIVSGLAELFGAVMGLGYWYMYAMSMWVDRSVSAAMHGRIAGATVQGIGGVALSVWATHPLTLLLGYAFLEGAVRFCGAAFSEDILGTLPLFLVDRILLHPFRRRNPASAVTGAGLVSNALSLVGAVGERVLTRRSGEVQDELCYQIEQGEEVLEICASRRKQDWIPPRTVRYENVYYRLESSTIKAGPRPFRYMLRRLSAGVPGRTVLIYSPASVLSRE